MVVELIECRQVVGLERLALDLAEFTEFVDHPVDVVVEPHALNGGISLVPY